MWSCSLFCWLALVCGVPVGYDSIEQNNIARRDFPHIARRDFPHLMTSNNGFKRYKICTRYIAQRDNIKHAMTHPGVC
jgi:hypothetical protein